MTDPATNFFEAADKIQRRPITEAQMRDAVEALQRLELYRDAYSDLIAALAAQSGDSPSSIRQVVKARADGSEKDLIDKLQGTLDLLTGGASLRDYFAAAALTGLLAHERYGSESPSKLADYAYDQADMMLARRGAQ